MRAVTLLVIAALFASATFGADQCDLSSIVLRQTNYQEKIEGFSMNIPVLAKMHFRSDSDPGLKQMALEVTAGFGGFEPIFKKILAEKTPDSSCTNKFSSDSKGVSVSSTGRLVARYKAKHERRTCVFGRPQATERKAEARGKIELIPSLRGQSVELDVHAPEPDVELSGLFPDLINIMTLGFASDAMDDLAQDLASDYFDLPKDLDLIIGQEDIPMPDHMRDILKRIKFEHASFKLVNNVPTLKIYGSRQVKRGTACDTAEDLRELVKTAAWRDYGRTCKRPSDCASGACQNGKCVKNIRGGGRGGGGRGGSLVGLPCTSDRGCGRVLKCVNGRCKKVEPVMRDIVFEHDLSYFRSAAQYMASNGWRPTGCSWYTYHIDGEDMGDSPSWCVSSYESDSPREEMTLETGQHSFRFDDFGHDYTDSPWRESCQGNFVVRHSTTHCRARLSLQGQNLLCNVQCN